MKRFEVHLPEKAVAKIEEKAKKAGRTRKRHVEIVLVKYANSKEE